MYSSVLSPSAKNRLKAQRKVYPRQGDVASVSQARQKQRPPVLHRELRKIQMIIKEHYKEMYVMWKQYSENDFFENE